MVTLGFSDFNTTYVETNKFFLSKPQYFNHYDSTRGLVEDLIIEIGSINYSDIDLGELGYTRKKWSDLLRTYLDADAWEDFRKKIGKSSGNSIAFDFKRKTTGNGACLREIILTRPKRGKPFNSAKIIWRATELQKRWGADLILIGKMLEDLENCNFESVTFYIGSAYQSAMFIVPFLWDIFGVRSNGFSKESKHEHHRAIRKYIDKYYQPDSKPEKLAVLARLQAFHQKKLGGYKPKKIDNDTLKLR